MVKRLMRHCIIIIFRLSRQKKKSLVKISIQCYNLVLTHYKL